MFIMNISAVTLFGLAGILMFIFPVPGPRVDELDKYVKYDPDFNKPPEATTDQPEEVTPPSTAGECVEYDPELNKPPEAITERLEEEEFVAPSPPSI